MSSLVQVMERIEWSNPEMSYINKAVLLLLYLVTVSAQ